MRSEAARLIHGPSSSAAKLAPGPNPSQPASLATPTGGVAGRVMRFGRTRILRRASSQIIQELGVDLLVGDLQSLSCMQAWALRAFAPRRRSIITIWSWSGVLTRKRYAFIPVRGVQLLRCAFGIGLLEDPDEHLFPVDYPPVVHASVVVFDRVFETILPWHQCGI